jgi:hypothetical protein
MGEQHLGAATGGVWTTADARAAGVCDRSIQYRLETGVWQRVRRGIYCDGGIVPSPQMRAWAAVLSAGGPGRAWVTGRTVLRLYELPLIDDDDPATGGREARHDDVTVLGARRDQPTLHPSRRCVPQAQRGSIRGCPAVALEPALVQAAALLSHEALVCVLDAALHRGLATRESLELLVAARVEMPDVRPLRRAVELADGRAESPLETLGRLALLPVLPNLEPQVQIRDGRGRLLARVDLGDPLLRLAVEGDGRATHGAMAADDHRRDRALRAVGWWTERYTWFDVRCRAPALQRRIAAAAGQRQCA